MNPEFPRVLTRREAIAAGIAATAAMLGCTVESLTGVPATPRLTARPGSPRFVSAPGLVTLDLHTDRRALLYVPSGYTPSVPAPFVLMFHGAGGSANGPIELFRARADELGLLLLACDAHDETWDRLLGRYGIDTRFVDRALAAAFDRCNVDASRVTVEGFSDGATYAIGIGRANGDLFSRVAAFSAGFLLPTKPRGKPDFFISHGVSDQVLSVENARAFVAVLEQEYNVTYKEFAGGHGVPASIVTEATAWMTQPR